MPRSLGGERRRPASDTSAPDSSSSVPPITLGLAALFNSKAFIKKQRKCDYIAKGQIKPSMKKSLNLNLKINKLMGGDTKFFGEYKPLY